MTDNTTKIPDSIIKLVAEVVHCDDYNMDSLTTPRNRRQQLSRIVGYRMGDFRFDKAFRHEETPTHSLIYAAIDTVLANFAAEEREAGRAH